MPFPASASLPFSSSPGVPATALKAYPSPPGSAATAAPAPHLPDDARAQHLAVEGATNRLVLSANVGVALGAAATMGWTAHALSRHTLRVNLVFSLSLVLRICLSRMPMTLAIKCWVRLWSPLGEAQLLAGYVLIPLLIVALGLGSMPCCANIFRHSQPVSPGADSADRLIPSFSKHTEPGKISGLYLNGNPQLKQAPKKLFF